MRSKKRSLIFDHLHLCLTIYAVFFNLRPVGMFKIVVDMISSNLKLQVVSTYRNQSKPGKSV